MLQNSKTDQIEGIGSGGHTTHRMMSLSEITELEIRYTKQLSMQESDLQKWIKEQSSTELKRFASYFQFVVSTSLKPFGASKR